MKVAGGHGFGSRCCHLDTLLGTRSLKISLKLPGVRNQELTR